MIIGRKEEQRILLSAAQSEYSELIAVYGRRRVGKTYLIRETFGYKFTFQHTGLANAKTKDQLFSFAISLRDAGYDDCPTPQSWYRTKCQHKDSNISLPLTFRLIICHRHLALLR